jgi:hypothetical protein
MRTWFAVLIVIGASLFGEAQQPKTEWRVLFDGTSLDAWRGYKTDKIPSGWRIADGLLGRMHRLATSSQRMSSATSNWNSNGKSARQATAASFIVAPKNTTTSIGAHLNNNLNNK